MRIVLNVKEIILVLNVKVIKYMETIVQILVKIAQEKKVAI
jgi:hypothetical protein